MNIQALLKKHIPILFKLLNMSVYFRLRKLFHMIMFLQHDGLHLSTDSLTLLQALEGFVKIAWDKVIVS